jgi:hypothetical protein
MSRFIRRTIRCAAYLVASGGIGVGAYKATFQPIRNVGQTAIGATVRYAGEVEESEEYIPGGAAAYILKDFSGKVVVITAHGAPGRGKHLVISAQRDETDTGEPCVRETKRWGSF